MKMSRILSHNNRKIYVVTSLVQIHLYKERGWSENYRNKIRRDVG